MPTYSYRCTDCDTAFDIHQAFTDDSLTVCPQCGGTLRKVFSPIGVSFNGPGFYRTDSRAKSGGEKHTSHHSSTSETASTGTAAPAAAGSSSTGGNSTSTKSTTASGDKHTASKTQRTTPATHTTPSRNSTPHPTT